MRDNPGGIAAGIGAMDRRQRPTVTRRRLAAALLLALGLSGCGGNSNLQFSSGGAPAGTATGGSVSVYGTTTFGTLLTIGFVGAALSGGYRAPEMDPSRRIAERDCTKPIEDWSANLRCR
jgi:hypothetical protein